MSAALIHQISVAEASDCPRCGLPVGSELGHIEDLRLGCRCCIHYECLIGYLREQLMDRESVIARGGIVCPFGDACRLRQRVISKSQCDEGTGDLADLQSIGGPVLSADETAGNEDEQDDEPDMSYFEKYFAANKANSRSNSASAAAEEKGVYLIAEDDLSAVASYGKTEDGGLDAILEARLTQKGFERLTIEEVNTFSRALILGGWDTMAVDDPEIIRYAQFAFDNSSFGNSDATFEVRHAKRQVVAGINIDMIIYIYLNDQRSVRHFRVFDRFDRLILTSEEELSSASPEVSPATRINRE